MTLTVNGNVLNSEARTLADFFTQKAIETRHIIVELNQEVLPKNADFSSILLNEGDDINVLHIVGGG